MVNPKTDAKTDTKLIIYDSLEHAKNEHLESVEAAHPVKDASETGALTPISLSAPGSENIGKTLQ